MRAYAGRPTICKICKGPLDFQGMDPQSYIETYRCDSCNRTVLLQVCV